MHCTAKYATGASKSLSPVKLRRSFAISYLVVILKYFGTYNAFIPDVPGCVAASTDLEEVKQLIATGLELHLPTILESGRPLPQPSTEPDDYNKQLEVDDELVEYGELYVKGEIQARCA